jgi:hypothetical protein
MTHEEAWQRALGLYAAGMRNLMVVADRGYRSITGDWIYIVIDRATGKVLAA